MQSFFSGVLTIIALFVLTDLQGQDALTQKFGAEAINEIQGTYKYEVLQYQNLHGYAVQDLSGIKDVSEYPDALEILPAVEGAPSLTGNIITEGFELFAYSFPVSRNQNQYYRIGNSGKLLTIYSTESVKKLYSEQNEE